MSDSEKTSTQLSRDGSLDPEEESFLGHNNKKHGEVLYTKRHVYMLYGINLSLLIAVVALLWAISNMPIRDPSLGVYCELNLPQL